MDADNQINLQDATVRGADVYLFAGKDSFAVTNLLDGYANTELTMASLGAGIAAPLPSLTIDEANAINVQGTSSILALEDVNLVAREGLGGDEQPMLESEVTVVEGDAEMPDFAVDKAYAIRFELREDRTVDMVQNVTRVRDADDNKVYKYIAADGEIALPDADFTDGATWEYVDTLPAEQAEDWHDPASQQYDGDFVNYSYSEENWMTGSGWLRQKTVHTKTTTLSGLKDSYTHALRPDYPVGIEFIAGPENPTVTIDTVGDLILQGNLTVPGTADGANVEVSLTTGGSVTAVDGVTRTVTRSDNAGYPAGSTYQTDLSDPGNRDVQMKRKDSKLLFATASAFRLEATSANLLGWTSLVDDAESSLP